MGQSGSKRPHPNFPGSQGIRQSGSLPLTSKAYGKAGLKSPTPKLKTPTPDESGVSPEQVREQLHKIVASRTLRQSKRLVRFLSFIVERALLGQGTRSMSI